MYVNEIKKGGALNMKMQKQFTATGKEFYFVVDDDGKVVAPIFSYLKHLSISKMSKNTVRTNCLHLLAFWRYITAKEIGYIDFVGKKSSTNKGAYENLVDYKLYLLYPDLGSNVIPINGLKPVRKEKTVNQMLSSVISFYKYLSDAHLVEPLPVIQQMQTLQHTHSMLNQMFLTKKKAVKNLLYSKVPDEPVKSITEEQFNKCWDACTCRRNKVIIGLMYYGGLRVSEVVGLNIEDLRDIFKNVIHIVQRDNNENVDAAVKYNSIGEVVIDDRLRDEIITYLNEDLKGIDTNYLIINFSGENMGGAMKTKNIRKMVSRLGKKVEIKNLHPHMFRHGCAVRLLRAGFDMKDIADKLRHKSIETTSQVYARFSLDDKIRVQKELSKKLEQDFAPYDINFDEIANFLLEDDSDE